MNRKVRREENIEDAIDIREARKALAELAREGQKTIPYEKVRRAMGLHRRGGPKHRGRAGSRTGSHQRRSST